jgi:hypothetical protein
MFTVGTLKTYISSYIEVNGYVPKVIKTHYGTHLISELTQLPQWDNDDCTIEDLIKGVK